MILLAIKSAKKKVCDDGMDDGWMDMNNKRREERETKREAIYN